MRLPCWTEDMEFRALQLDEQGLSKRRIAKALQQEFGYEFTKNMLSGKLWRMKKDS